MPLSLAWGSPWSGLRIWVKGVLIKGRQVGECPLRGGWGGSEAQSVKSTPHTWVSGVRTGPSCQTLGRPAEMPPGQGAVLGWGLGWL